MRLQIALLVPALLALGPLSRAQMEVPPTVSVDYHHDTGWVANDSDHEQIVIAFPVFFDVGRSLRLYFEEVALAGSPYDGTGSILRVTSLLDGGQQTMNAEHVRQWQRSTAYFNGEAVMVEVIAQPRSGKNRLVLKSLDVGLASGVGDSQCGATDDRVPSSDPRVGRLMPVVCTAWMINDCNRCFLSAGHCVGSIDTVQFNVPLSSSGGSLNHPPPQHQYAVDPASVQSNGGQGTGNDWAYFGCFPNSVTGLPPAVAQGAFFTLQAPPPLAGNTIRITGHGSDSGVNNFIQQTHAGPFVSDSGTVLGYQTDTQGGNSGSPVIWDQADVAIGIHTHGGCSSGQNSGTDIMNHAAFQAALANPQGLCSACGPPTISQLSPAQMKVFPAASLSILGSNLSSVQAVSVGGVVYGPGQFSVIDGGRIDVTPVTPAALGSVPVTVTNPQGVSNALDLTWVATAPPAVVAPLTASAGQQFTWNYAGTPGDTAYLILSFTSGAFTHSGHLILNAPIILKVAPLTGTGLDSLSVTIPAALGLTFFYSQVVTLNGGVTGASSIVPSIVFP
jgi:V8-like Glu-specific endopeptidase